ncbi:hypothetical protein LZ31DRAFT_150788 [Colletotrichum somersetense]|nr:hypothetical protein LZ31DRAFT_150788 [Colletotrichum somersetense]
MKNVLASTDLRYHRYLPHHLGIPHPQCHPDIEERRPERRKRNSFTRLSRHCQVVEARQPRGEKLDTSSRRTPRNDIKITRTQSPPRLPSTFVTQGSGLRRANN